MTQPDAHTSLIHRVVTYTPCATSSRKKTVNKIKFTQFEEENLLSETRNVAEIGDESNDNSLIPPLLRKEEMDVMDFGDKSGPAVRQ